MIDVPPSSVWSRIGPYHAPSIRKKKEVRHLRKIHLINGFRKGYLTLKKRDLSLEAVSRMEGELR